LFPSFYDTEALPISMLEALSCGCFVIATDHNYLPDLLPAENSLVPIRSPKEILRTIGDYVLLDEAMRLQRSRSNISYAHLNYSHQKYTATMNLLLNE
jgi:glycosyltransferase involved in cell wall biosynthesis